MLIGYARVSTVDQNDAGRSIEDLMREALADLFAKHVYTPIH